MSRFDAAADLLAARWGFAEPRLDQRDKVWTGEVFDEQIRAHGDGKEQYLRFEHDGMRLTRG
jgi:hypothetical protein